MTILKLKYFPDPILRQKAKIVDNLNEGILKLLEDMSKTMYNAKGIGLAANQVGELKRIIVVDCSEKEENTNNIEENSLIKMINPEIISYSKEISELEEGCLSIPPYKALVKRPSEILVRFIDSSGKENKINASGILSACIQHEIDHLNGRLFIDHISRIKRNMIMRKIQKNIKDNKNKDKDNEP